jgi:hypothetical protein
MPITRLHHGLTDTTNDMQGKKLHKTLLILALVIVPPYFLIFTDEGARISDNVILWLFGERSIKLNLKELDAAYRAEEIRVAFPDLAWECRDEDTAFGDRVCTAPVGAVNDYPSRHLTAFFAGDRISALKIVYRERYHDQWLGHLIEQLGQPRNVEEAIREAPDAATVLEWDTGKGMVVLKKDLRPGDEPAMFWLAGGRS